MRVTKADIDPGLRPRARWIRFVSAPNRSEAALRRPQRFAALTRLVRSPEGIRATQHWISRPDGSRLRLRIYRPHAPRPNAPGLLWLHGGGYVLGSPEQDGASYARIIEATGAAIVAPDYRPAPEAPDPAALDDAYAALLWLRDSAAALSVRCDQLAVAGNSAGGGLTAALTLLARDRGEVAITFQMPLYPMIDDRCATESQLSGQPNDGARWGSGFQISSPPFSPMLGAGSFGHTGAGGQLAFGDIEHTTSFAYVPDQMGGFGDRRATSLTEALRGVLGG